MAEPADLPARDAFRAALAQLMDDAGLASKTQLARRLSEAAAAHDVRSASTGKAVGYDPAMVNRWLDGKLVPSRQAAWLLDMTYGRPQGQPTFEDLRDRYVLENDREQAPVASARDLPRIDNARCPADSVASLLPRRPLPLADDDVLGIGFFTVVDCELARKIITTLLDRTPEVRGLAAYEVLGRWDLVVKVAAPAGFDLVAFHDHVLTALAENGMVGDQQTHERADFTDHRLVVTPVSGVQSPSGGPARFLVPADGDHYDRLRVQRGFLVMELRSVPELRRAVAVDEIRKKVAGLAPACGDIVEAVTVTDDAVVLDVVQTCAKTRYLGQLNREMGRLLTWFEARKTNLVAFTVDESGWLRADAG